MATEGVPTEVALVACCQVGRKRLRNGNTLKFSYVISLYRINPVATSNSRKFGSVSHHQEVQKQSVFHNTMNLRRVAKNTDPGSKTTLSLSGYVWTSSAFISELLCLRWLYDVGGGIAYAEVLSVSESLS